MTTSNVVRGWRNAAKRSGRSAQALRKLVLAGTLSTWKGADGISEFNAADLDALRATLLGPTGAVIVGEIATSATIAASGTNSAVTAPAASSSTGAVTSPSPSPMLGTIAPWLAEAVRARDFAGVEAVEGTDDRDDEPGDIYQPFWEAVTTLPALPVGEPFVDPVTRVITYRPVSAAAQTSAPHGALVEQLQAQLVELQGQLATAQAESAGWRGAWRAERSRGVAAQEALQAALAGREAQVVQAVQAAVAQALAAIADDRQLGDDQVAFGHARAVGGHVAAGWSTWAAETEPQPGGDDLSRARRRRARRW